MVDYTIHVPDEVYEQIKQAAARDQRSIHREILWLIKRGLETEQRT